MTPPIDLRKEFPLRDGLIYLNHAAMGVWPRRTARAVAAFADQNLRQGAADYPRWLETEARLRARCARLVNAGSPDDIAFVANTSEALSIVAAGLDWHDGDNVVITDQEFPSNRMPWEMLAGRGVETRVAALRDEATPEDAIAAQCDARTRLISVSSVQYATGLRMDLQALGGYCAARGILFCVDAIQSLGALPLDVQALNIDFAMADAHKWLLGPEGIAVFYSSPAARDRLSLTRFGWHMRENYLDFDGGPWTPARSARRFECGSPNMLGIHALDASLSLFEEVGMDAVTATLLSHGRRIIGGLSARPGFRIVTPATEGRFGSSISFQALDIDSNILFEDLSSAGVVCALRQGAIRLSPHFYTPGAHIDRALEIVRRHLPG